MGALLVLAVVTGACSLTDGRTDGDRSLFGTRWVSESLTSAGTSTPTTIGAGLFFDGKGGFTGSTGCAPIGGTAVISGNRITMTIAGSPTPGPTCTGDRLTLHNTMLAILRSEAGWDVDWQWLTLTGSDGTELVLALKLI